MEIIDNKNILKSYIGDKQIVKKIINGTVVYGQPDFASYYQIDKFNNYTIVGSPTIENGIVNNFSTSNYLTLPAPDLSTSNNWEIATKVNIPRLTGSYQVFFTGSANHQFVGVDITSSGALLAAIGNSSGNGWQVMESSNTWKGTRKVIPLNTDFWAKITFNGSKYSIYYSDDGENWEETIYYESTQKIYHDPTNILSIGIGRMHDAFVCSGSIDLYQTYIKIDGKYYFNGNPNYGELSWCNPNVYLQNSESSYINTGFSCDSTTDMSACFTYLNNTVLDLAGASSFYFTKGSSGYKLNFGDSSSYTQLGNSTVFYPNLKSTAYYKGNEIGLNGLTSTITRGTDTNPIYLFRKQSRSEKNWKGKVYWFELSKNNTVVQHLVPVPKGLMIGSYIVPENGMFDITTQTFFANAGTGTFSYGIDL